MGLDNRIVVETVNFISIFMTTIYFTKKELRVKDKAILFFIGIITIMGTLLFDIYRVCFIIYLFLYVLYFIMIDLIKTKFLLYLIITNVSLICLYLITMSILKECNVNFYIEDFSFRFILAIQLGVINFIILVLGKNILIKIKNKKFKLEKNSVILSIVMISIIVISFKCNVLGKNFESCIIVLLIILSFMLCYFVMLHMKKEEEIIKKEINIKSLEKYIKLLENLNGGMRRFKHDYMNILASMSGYFNLKDFEGLKKYFNNNIQPLGEEINSKNLRIGLLGNVEVYEIKGLLLNKAIKTEECGIKLYIDIPERITNVKIEKVDLVRALGIILDNAIEAAEESKEKILMIGIFEQNNGINFIVENSFVNKGVYLHEILKTGFSTKGKNRGLGLEILNNTLEKYENMVKDTNIEKNRFIQHITIY